MNSPITNPLVALLILNWNRSAMTLSLIKNIRESELGRNYTILIVDNGSKKEEFDVLLKGIETMQNWVIISEEDIDTKKNIPLNDCKNIMLRLEKNYGYAKGNNYGLKLLEKLGYNYCFIVNNDVVFDPNILPKLIAGFSQNDKLAILGPKIIGPNGRTQGPISRPTFMRIIVYYFFFPLWWIAYRFLEKITSNSRKRVLVRKVFAVVGCFMLCDIKKLSEVGFFDENTFLYHEEIILSEKLMRKGYLTGYVERFTVKHMHAQSTKLKKKSELRRYSIESEEYYLREYRNYGALRLGVVRAGKLIMEFVWLPIIDSLKELKRTFSGNRIEVKE